MVIMSGLFQRALDIRAARSKLRVMRPDEFEEEDDLQISQDEREQILAEIETTLKIGPAAAGQDIAEIPAERRAGVLPILVNLVAVLLIAGCFFAALYYFQRQEQDIVTQRAGIASAEGQLLQTLKKEAEQELAQKDVEISDIQRNLAEIITERQSLLTDMETTITEKEVELREELALQIESERERLSGSELTEEEVSSRLEDVEAKLQREYDEMIVTSRAKAQVEIRQQENTLNAMISEYEDSLTKAESEKANLARDLAAREAELSTQMEEERVRFREEIATLEDNRNREQFALNQMLAFYQNTQTHIAAGAPERALDSLKDLKSFLSDASLAGLPMVQNRRQVEIFLIDSLERLIENELKTETLDTESLIESAKIIASVSALVEEGNVLYAEGSYLDAQQQYLSALSRIEPVKTGFDRYQEIEYQKEVAQSDLVNGLVANGDRYFADGNNDSAISEYENALAVLYQTDTAFIQRIRTAGAEIESRSYLDELEGIRTELANSRKSERGLIEGNRQEVRDLQAEISRLSEEIAEYEGISDELDASQERIGEQIAELEASGERIAELEIYEAENRATQNLITSISAAKERLATNLTGSDEPEQSANSAQFLETKLLIVRVLSNEPVKSEYPDLQNRLNEYLVALTDEERIESRDTTLRAINDMLEELISPGADDQFASLDGMTQSNLMLRFLSNLQALLEQ
jgi:chromosome segregation ATPase